MCLVSRNLINNLNMNPIYVGSIIGHNILVQLINIPITSFSSPYYSFFFCHFQYRSRILEFIYIYKAMGILKFLYFNFLFAITLALLIFFDSFSVYVSSKQISFYFVFMSSLDFSVVFNNANVKNISNLQNNCNRL